ncbi:hypothetical protein GYMLUDRAFT_244136 [Collybiopsis luxurians FD-317 M1]|uniref:Uncharacterized protein n=1 Tax=Collybiopsis luxurians FD-317 M1 TaxID=944289 RepID=A0A0D0CP08_9AGAR|nr:hypothetical protein GYMLUDRAFT_244136 [Collybiopsis luxurians FD-317 M1]
MNKGKEQEDENSENKNEQVELIPMDIDSSADGNYDLVTDEDDVFPKQNHNIKFKITPPSLNDNDKQDQLFSVTSNNESVKWGNSEAAKAKNGVDKQQRNLGPPHCCPYPLSRPFPPPHPTHFPP